MKQALFWRPLKGKAVQCQLCPHFCSIKPEKRGKCGVRENVKGKLYSLVYGRPCSLNADPIEKKPLFHFAPGTACFSISTVGCNLGCLNCQNWEISHPEAIFGQALSPEGVVGYAKDNKLPGIAYTYTEPTVFFEYALDTMKLARKAGLYNVWVSNGYINPGPAKMAAKYLDAINIDLKGDREFYRKVCGVPDNRPVLEAMKLFRGAGVWVELTNLLIPGYNDMEKQIRELVDLVRKGLGPGTPLHFSRFYPCYKMGGVKPTPVETLEGAWEIAKGEGMQYAYVGNVAGHPRENTYCPKCGEVAIKRTGYYIEFIKGLTAKNEGKQEGEKSSLREGLKCPRCGESIPLAGKGWMRG